MRKLLYEHSTRQDGNLSLRHESAAIVVPRREAFLATYGITSADCVFIETEHDEKITHVNAVDKGSAISTEALITSEPGVVLFLLAGDCFPVSFYDEKKQVIGLAHLGWKPTNKELAYKVVKEMVEVYGSQPGDIKVFIGPGIHKESYVFQNPIQKSMPNWTPYLTDLPHGETQIDLIAYISDQVVRAGVKRDHIQVNETDTATSEEYFSHYRAVRTGEPEARFATILSLP